VALDPHVSKKLDTLPGLGSSNYTVSGAIATVTGSLSAQQLEDLFHAAFQVRHEVAVVSGAVKVQPRA
jgi:hypothetical protein